MLIFSLPVGSVAVATSAARLSLEKLWTPLALAKLRCRKLRLRSIPVRCSMHKPSAAKASLSAYGHKHLTICLESKLFHYHIDAATVHRDHVCLTKLGFWSTQQDRFSLKGCNTVKNLVASDRGTIRLQTKAGKKTKIISPTLPLGKCGSPLQ